MPDLHRSSFCPVVITASPCHGRNPIRVTKLLLGYSQANPPSTRCSLPWSLYDIHGRMAVLLTHCTACYRASIKGGAGEVMASSIQLTYGRVEEGDKRRAGGNPRCCGTFAYARLPEPQNGRRHAYVREAARYSNGVRHTRLRFSAGNPTLHEHLHGDKLIRLPFSSIYSMSPRSPAVPRFPLPHWSSDSTRHPLPKIFCCLLLRRLPSFHF
jgi:hypothetical protein